MSRQVAADEYALALKQGQKEHRELIMAGREPYPAVLDEILSGGTGYTAQEIGTLDIPSERIIGTKSAGRISAFTASFQPLLEQESEFAIKWINLCTAHLSDEGIRDPIVCYEYLGDFYVQEGNKRVSVLKHFDAPRIPGHVTRILPKPSDEPRYKAYQEFLEFFNVTRLYTVKFRRPGDYPKLQSSLGRERDESWTEAERRSFNSRIHSFRDVFLSLNTRCADVYAEEALLVWLQVHPFRELSELSIAELKKTMTAMWDDLISANLPESVNVQTRAETGKSNLLTRLISAGPDHLNVAFVHQLEPSASAWVLGHEEGRKHIEALFGSRITVKSYCGAKDTENADRLIGEAVDDGADLVFTTAPILSRSALKAAVKHPKVRFFNCSVDQPYSSIRTYYGRIYEAKFITGAIAGAMAQDDGIGYIASYPIFGVPASINAFALGAQLTNPRAQIELRWSCCEGSPQADFFTGGIRVVSNRDVPTKERMYMDFCNYGTYLLDDRGELISLASPVWEWGKFYEFVIRAILTGAWKDDKSTYGAVNYWLGMDSGVIGVNLSDRLPQGVLTLAKLLQQDLTAGTLDPFFRRIVAQDGTVKNDGTRKLTPREVLHMDWLCDNIIGEIPTFDQILPISQAMVRELGIYRDKLLPEKERTGM